MRVQGIEKLDIFLTFFNMDISLDRQQKSLRFCLYVVHYHIEGTVSRSFLFSIYFFLYEF